MQGIHIVANFYDCQYDFTQENSLLEHCINICLHHGLNVVGSTSHKFVPQGITFSILLAE